MVGKRSLVALSLLAAALFLVATTAMASAPTRHGPIQGNHRVGRDAVSSSNWSGYAAYGTTFNYVQGSWVVPTANCSNVKGHQTTIASPWVGLDGYKSNTVEQTGTDSDCLGRNAPAYYAWYEFYPAGPVFDTAHTVNAGDHMTAYVSVNVGNGTVNTTLHDDTANWTYSSPAQPVGNLQFNSAEWILEKPSNRLTSLSGGAVNFSGAFAIDSSNHTGAINDTTDWSYDSITLVNHPGPHGTTLASPGTIMNPGGTSSFTITTG